jgi:hypothetical protein
LSVATTPANYTVYWICPVVTTDPGTDPAAKGDPLTCVSVPFTALMLNTETSFESPFATYRNFPEKSTVTSFGPFPAVNGELGSNVKAPVEGSIE